jgi:hypothetical protein
MKTPLPGIVIIPLKRSKEKRHSNHYSAIEIDGLLTGYFLYEPVKGNYRR